MDRVIKEYFEEKMEARIKSKVKGNMTDDEIQEIEQSVSNEFSLDLWLPNAAKRAKQLTIVTHNGKLTHTGVKKESAVFVTSDYRNDGYVRTGNVDVDFDIIGNAAALDVFKFLGLVFNGKTILQHLEQDTPEIRKEFDIPTASYEEISKGFLEIKKNNEDAITSDRLKQVYFPVDDGYHLLSLLTPSGIVYKLKEKISNMKFSEVAKTARSDKKTDKYNENGFSDIYGLTVIGFGGTKPQNAGNLSNQNGGRAYLLRSMPPELSKRDISPPKKSFFTDSLNSYFFKNDFETLYHILEVDKRKNKDIRDRRDKIFLNIINKAIDLLWKIRILEPGWSDSDYYSNLNKHEKIWLDGISNDKREDNDTYLPYVKKELCLWIIRTYSRSNKDKKIVIPDDDLRHLRNIIDEHKEGLR